MWARSCRRSPSGAGSAVDRIRRLYPKELEASKEAIRARLPRQAQGEYALRMAAQERILHLLFAHRGGRKDPRRTPVQAGGTALSPPQRRMGLRYHRQITLRSMRAAAMDDYFFNGKNRTQSKYAGRAGMARRHPGPVDKGRLPRPTCAKNEGFAIRATLANLSTVTLATLRPGLEVGKCYSVASLTVCEFGFLD